MSSIHNVLHRHAHHSPPHVKKAALKAARSAPSKSALTPKITIKAAKSSRKVKEEEEEVFDYDNDDDDMATSFLQFCAMCEKQIVVPNASILYCSESCRRRDAASPTSTVDTLHVINSPTKTPPFYDAVNPCKAALPVYVSALQPTPRTIPAGRIPAKFHSGKADLDPTEWKPSDPAQSTEGKSPTKSLGGSGVGEWKPKLSHRPSSEASSYLSKFHASSDSLVPKRRPAVGRATMSSPSTPGLSHTPTASTSSEESLSGTPYEFVSRPALSMPTAAITSTKSTSGGNHECSDFTYEKKVVKASFGSASGSLKKLLGTATVTE